MTKPIQNMLQSYKNLECSAPEIPISLSLSIPLYPPYSSPSPYPISFSYPLPIHIPNSSPYLPHPCFLVNRFLPNHSLSIFIPASSLIFTPILSVYIPCHSLSIPLPIHPFPYSPPVCVGVCTSPGCQGRVRRPPSTRWSATSRRSTTAVSCPTSSSLRSTA